MKEAEEESSSEEGTFCGYTARVTPTFSTTTQLEWILHQEESKFQEIGIMKTTDFGKTLTIDKRIQSAELDEFIYHESLVHPAMIAHDCPKSVFIAGGGEGATAREVLRHKTVERLVMVEIDEAVVEVCKKHLPEWVGGCYDDPRMKLVIGDAKAWIEKTNEKFDVIIFDIFDPAEGGPGIAMYFQSLYQTVLSKLNSGGIFVTQSGGAGLLTYMDCFTVIHNTMRVSFPHTYAFFAEVPSFGTSWGFNMGLKDGGRLPDKHEINTRINKRMKDPETLRFYDGLTHQGMFGLPKYIKLDIEKERRVLKKYAMFGLPKDIKLGIDKERRVPTKHALYKE